MRCANVQPWWVLFRTSGGERVIAAAICGYCFEMKGFSLQRPCK